MNLSIAHVQVPHSNIIQPKSINWKYNFKILMDSVADYARQWAKREKENVETLSEWLKSVRSLIQIRINNSMSQWALTRQPIVRHLSHLQGVYNVVITCVQLELFWQTFYINSSKEIKSLLWAIFRLKRKSVWFQNRLFHGRQYFCFTFFLRTYQIKKEKNFLLHLLILKKLLIRYGVMPYGLLIRYGVMPYGLSY